MLKHTHLQPSEIERMPFYEIEYLIESLENMAKKEDELYKKEEMVQQSKVPSMNANNLMNQVGKNKKKL